MSDQHLTGSFFLPHTYMQGLFSLPGGVSALCEEIFFEDWRDSLMKSNTFFFGGGRGGDNLEVGCGWKCL